MQLSLIIVAAIVAFIIAIGMYIIAVQTATPDPNEEIYKTHYTVYYMPPLSVEGKQTIQKHITPNMSSEETAIYSIDDIMININAIMPVSDLSFLARIEKRGIEFIEF